MARPPSELLMDESSWLLLVYMTRNLSSVSSSCNGAAPISDGIFFIYNNIYLHYSMVMVCLFVFMLQ